MLNILLIKPLRAGEGKGNLENIRVENWNENFQNEIKWRYSLTINLQNIQLKVGEKGSFY